MNAKIFRQAPIQSVFFVYRQVQYQMK